MKTFDTEMEVYFEDISPSGKIHLEKIAEWMSIARERYFKATCPAYLEFIDNPIKMFTANMTISLTGESRWADKILVTLTSSSIKKFSFEINAEFKNLRTAQIIAKGLQKVIFIDSQGTKFCDIPEYLKINVIQYQRQ